MSIEILLLGTGTSLGVPVIGCDCTVCTSQDPRNRRTRTSAWIRYGGKSILIDTTPELRIQALAHGMNSLNALLFTHAHADHIFGFDDIRRFNQLQKEVIPIYGTRRTLDGLRKPFDYAFDPVTFNPNIPQVASHVVTGPFDLFGLTVKPLTVMHGSLPVTAYRFCDIAYVTDCNSISDDTMHALQGLDILILDALRYEPHPTHFSLKEALEIIERLKPERAFLTHLSHAFDHAQVEEQLPRNVSLAYDGLLLRSDSIHPQFI